MSNPIENVKEKIALSILIALGIILIILGFTYHFYFSYELDKGGLLSLAFTIALVTILPMIMFIMGKIKIEDIITFFKELDVTSAFIVSILLGAALGGLWLSVRRIGLFVHNYLFVEGYKYSQYDVFEMVSYILATSLCFTVLKTVKMAMGKEQMDKPSVLKGMVDITIQAVLIGIITLLPNYGNPTLLTKIGGSNIKGVIGFVSILLSMAIMLVSLIFIRKRIKE